MKIFAGIKGDKLNVGLLTDPAELEDSSADIVVVLVHYKMVSCGREAGAKRITFKPENWGKDVAPQPL